MDTAAALLRSADRLRHAISGPNGERTETEPSVYLQKLADLQSEFALYLAYGATVLELLSRQQNEANWNHLENNGGGGCVLDLLASIRQTLSVSPVVGRERLGAFRESQGLSASVGEATAGAG